MHAQVIGAIGEVLGVSVNTSQCGNAVNVKSLYRYQRAQGNWTNAYFMVDGDNQGNQFPDDQHYIHLPYYCIENLLLDPDILSIVSSKSVDQVREIMVGIFWSKRNIIFQKNKFFEFLADSLTTEHMTFERLKTFDASVVVDDIISSLDLVSLSELLPKYLKAARNAGCLDRLVSQQLLTAIQAAADKTVGNE